MRLEQQTELNFMRKETTTCGRVFYCLLTMGPLMSGYFGADSPNYKDYKYGMADRTCMRKGLWTYPVQALAGAGDPLCKFTSQNVG